MALLSTDLKQTYPIQGQLIDTYLVDWFYGKY